MFARINLTQKFLLPTTTAIGAIVNVDLDVLPTSKIISVCTIITFYAVSFAHGPVLRGINLRSMLITILNFDLLIVPLAMKRFTLLTTGKFMRSDIMKKLSIGTNVTFVPLSIIQWMGFDFIK